MVLRAALGRADELWTPAAGCPAVIREARAYLALYAALAAAALAFRSPLPLLLWVAPALMGQPVLRAVLLAEHAGLPRVGDRPATIRTTLAGRLFGPLFWNANYHAEHHLAPGVPFHAPPKLHGLVHARLAALERGYPAAQRSIRAALAR